MCLVSSEHAVLREITGFIQWVSYFKGNGLINNLQKHTFSDKHQSDDQKFVFTFLMLQLLPGDVKHHMVSLYEDIRINIPGE